MSNWIAEIWAQGQDMGGDADAADWRTQLPEGFRQRIVNTIMDTLKRHLHFPGEEGIQEHKKIVVRFEEKTYTAATSQSDYLRKISMEILRLERESQNPTTNSYQFNAARNSQNPQYPAAATAAVGMDAGDWRTQLRADSRQRIANKIMDVLRRHIPFSTHEGLQELNEIAVKFEEKTFAGATSQSDYLRKISLKMLTMEIKSQNPTANSIQFNAAGSTSQNTHDPEFQESSYTGEGSGS